jgi:hypothetical protein
MASQASVAGFGAGAACAAGCAGAAPAGTCAAMGAATSIIISFIQTRILTSARILSVQGGFSFLLEVF